MHFTVIDLIAVLFAAFVCFILAARFYRRWMREADPRANDLTVEQLIAMRDAGQMTQTEFERARAVALSRSSAPDRPESGARGFDVITRSDGTSDE